jgi:hypothetical protein
LLALIGLRYEWFVRVIRHSEFMLSGSIQAEAMPPVTDGVAAVEARLSWVVAAPAAL